jgi:hypothetical protein
MNMKTSHFYIFLFLMCAAVVNAQNIVFQEDFESYENEFSLHGDVYKVWEGTASVVDVTGTENTAYQGVKYATSDASKVNWQFRKPITLEVGKTYTLKIATKAQDGTKHFVQIHPKTAYELSWIETYNADWQLHTTSFTVTAGNENVIIAVYRYAKIVVGVDAISLTEGGASNISSTKKEALTVNQTLDGNLNIYCPEVIKNLNIYNLSGRLVHSSRDVNNSRFTLSTNDLTQGVYILSVVDNSGNKIAKKVIKQ